VNIPAKIILSDLERTLISDPGWILAKNEVIRKMTLLFGQLSDQFMSNPEMTKLPEEVRIIPPKISKGENYKGLPYLVLDFPRYFDKNHVFAIRTFFWWGHCFSSTLHLKGRYRDQFADNVLKLAQTEQTIEWMMNHSEEEWVHDPKEIKHWIRFSEIKPEEIMNRGLFKLSAVLPIEKWEEANSFLSQLFNLYLKSL
jgi:hypothetical protein